MQIEQKVFWTHKNGGTAAEYEDAFCPLSVELRGGDVYRFAIADGATESSYSKQWARMLVDSFVADEETTEIAALLTHTQPRWLRVVGGRDLPWYAEQKVESGAFAAFLGLTLFHDPVERLRVRWKALAVGDACLVQVRSEEVVSRFPMELSSDFGDAPFLLSSDARQNAEALRRCRHSEGEVCFDDAFYLMTDALACWFLAECEQGHAPWQALRALDTGDEVEGFHGMVARLRGSGALKNDDTTLMRIDIAM